MLGVLGLGDGLLGVTVRRRPTPYLSISVWSKSSDACAKPRIAFTCTRERPPVRERRSALRLGYSEHRVPGRVRRAGAVPEFGQGGCGTGRLAALCRCDARARQSGRLWGIARSSPRRTSSAGPSCDSAIDRNQPLPLTARTGWMNGCRR